MDDIAIVTGASRGIGAATAVLLAERGFAVCVNYQAASAAAEAVVGAITAHGGRAIAVQADVSRRDDVERLFETCDRELGTLSALVNNAGIHGPRGRIDVLAPEALERVLDINVFGLILCAQAAVRRMSTRHGGRGGSIINISSGAAHIGGAGEGVQYATSKGAVNSFTIGLSQEVAGEGIRVNAVSPGLTVTEMPPAQKLAELGPRIPMGRAGEAREIAEAVAWLASPQASYVAGANLRVSGGRP